MKPTTPVSACVISYNEAGRIGDCLRSLAFCADRLVIDSHSTDSTREEAGARVIERDWPGYRSQKQYAVDQAQHDWVLCLDADERVSPELEAAIRAVFAGGAPAAAPAGPAARSTRPSRSMARPCIWPATCSTTPTATTRTSLVSACRLSRCCA